jgi:hypothetical protein
MDESVETQYRFMKSSGLALRHYWLMTAIICFFSLLATIFFTSSLFDKFKFAAYFSAVLGLAHFLNREATLRKIIRKQLKRQHGTDQPIETEFELSEDGIIYRALGCTTVFHWVKVMHIEEMHDSLEIHLQPSGLVMLPKKIFNEDEFLEWKQFIQNHSTQPVPSVA